MKREEMIARLSEEIIRVAPTVYTWDMGLQYDYITPEGAGSCLGAIGAWPILFLKGIQQEQWQEIRSKAEKGTLTPEDVKGTSLEVLANSLKDRHLDNYENFSETFSDLAELPAVLPDVFFCLYDVQDWNTHPDFYAEQSEMLYSFKNRYCGYVRSWDDMDDEEVKEWFDRLNDDLSGVACITYGMEEEEEE